MTSVSLLDVCFISTCSNALLLHEKHPLNVKKAAVARKTTTRPVPSSAWRHRNASHHRRHQSAPTSPYRRRRSGSLVYCPDFLRKTSRSFALNKFVSRRIEPIRPPPPNNKKQDKAAMEQMIQLQHSLEEAMFEPASPSAPASHPHRGGHCGGMDSKRVADDALSWPQTPSRDDFSETRSTRSASSASRNTNRLSLTLPIAPPTPNPSRPTPASSTLSSFPPTPTETPSLMSPTDPSDFITAIAAQERRVLELKEELHRAELELKKLKRQFTRDEGKRKLQAQRNAEPLRAIPPLIDLDDGSGNPRRSVETDRRRALLLGQQSQQNTPERNRRRVFRGGHARTLSLLSPTKVDDNFSVHEDGFGGPLSAREEPDSPYVKHYNPITPALLAKRASWAPRSAHQQASAMKQIADDLKTGIWTFVEDLRQVAIGDEPITGQGRYLRGADGNMRATMSRDDSYADNQETIRASGATSRPRAAGIFEDTPTPPSRFTDVVGQDSESSGPAKQMRTLSRSQTESSAANTRGKRHYSWTPLTVDDDEDWADWESPNPQTSDRWSGSTMVDGNLISTIPEKGDENETALIKEASKSRLNSRSPSPRTAAKLEELLPPVLNRLTPSNLKKQATDFMNEWEKSLSPPEPATPSKEKGM